MKRYYLAYGSNLNIRQMRYRCPGAKPIGITAIPDYQLLYKGKQDRSVPYHRTEEEQHCSDCGLGGHRS